MKHFINERGSIVTEAIEAEVQLSNGALRRLDGYPSIRVLLRNDWDREKVAIVSGGGAGHEPAHAGFVGPGMLTAAVSGDVFASPSVDAVLAAILAVTGAAGCLLVVKNYTGDRLNFGLAAERARAMGRKVEMVIVGDDIALPDERRPRGIAGTLFVHKLAGHVAENGGSLEEVKAVAERIAGVVVSIGVALTTCNMPGQAHDAASRIGDEQIELGLGIHGEPGAEIAAWAPVRALAEVMVERLEKALLARNGTGPVALLINDLGGVPPIELSVATQSILEAFARSRRDVRLVVGPARMMTSLDMKGISISALPLLDPTIEAAIVAPVGPRAWPEARRPTTSVPVPLPEAIAPRTHVPSFDAARREVLERICNALIDKQRELDALDAKVGDGDTGTTFATGARAILADIEGLPFAEPAALCEALSERMSRVMGGSSGILLAIFASAVAARVGHPPDWAAALAEGARRMGEYGGARAGDRTMLDALVPAIEALSNGQSLEAAARAASEGAARTATMNVARAGRSSYVREDALRGVPDPGAVAASAAFAAIAAR